MKCKKCTVVKLSKEFPASNLTIECDHPTLHCLRCVLGHWEKHKTCSQCNLPVDKSNHNLRECYAKIELLFPEITCDPDEEESASVDAEGIITITRLNGESFVAPFSPKMTIFELKRKVHQHMKVPPEKQNLLHKQNILQEFDKIRMKQNTLQMCSVKPNSTIHMMVLLYAIPSNLDKVVFDLYWGFPESGRDYLDACAWTFKGQRWENMVRFYQKVAHGGALRHSGDRMDIPNREGHQFINVNLQSIPSYITHIFFTLSSYSWQSISNFRNPSMRFYEASRPDVMLCEDKTNEAGHRQAIVMCSLQRIDGKWCVFGQGVSSDGHAMYADGMEQILETIREIIAKTSKYPYVPVKVETAELTDPEELAAVNARE